MPQIQTQNDKKYSKIHNFENFMQIFCTFRKTWWRRMLQTSIKEQISCRGGFFEEIKAVGVEKMHQINTEIDKKTKKIKFLKILCSFCRLFEKPGGLEG